MRLSDASQSVTGRLMLMLRLRIRRASGQDYYKATNPEECFTTEAGAQKHGYRKART